MTLAEAEELVRAWQDLSLDFEVWRHHRTHLTVALWHALNYPPEQALERMRVGIQRFNAAHGVEQTLTGGYHETLTCYWMHEVQGFVNRNRGLPFEQLLEPLLEQCAEKKRVLRHYSRDLIMSWEARTTRVEPDLEPLDNYSAAT